MKLLFDLGNSRCKYAVLGENGIMEYGYKNYEPFGKLYTVKSLCDAYEATKVIICSVLSEKMNADILETLQNKDGCDVYFLVAEKNSFGVELAYENPSAMGVDRVAALIAAKEKYSGSTCVVDCGTAITIDVLNASGAHQGGVIFPGEKAMRKGLLECTRITCDDAEVEFNAHASSTEQAIYTGCVSAVAGGIEYAIKKMSSNNDGFDQIVFTGGNAEGVKGHVDLQAQIEPTFVLDGLKIVAENI